MVGSLELELGKDNEVNDQNSLQSLEKIIYVDSFYKWSIGNRCLKFQKILMIDDNNIQK
jgi:hypothetical protein